MASARGSTDAAKVYSEHVPCFSDAVVVRPVDTSWLILDPEIPTWMIANTTGRDIVALCDGVRTIGDIARVLSDRFGVPCSRVEADVETFIRKAASAQLAGLGKAPVPVRRDYPERLPLESALICVTSACNLCCAHCYNASGDHARRELARDDVHRILVDLASAQAESVGFSGGEVLLHPDLWEMLTDAKQLGLRPKVATNGTLIDDDAARRFADLDCLLKISVDGPTAAIHDRMRGEGSFVRMQRGLDVLAKHVPRDRIGISFTPVHFNCRYINDMIVWMETQGLKKLHCSMLTHQGNASRHWDDLQMSGEEWTRVFLDFVKARQQRAVLDPEWQVTGICIDFLDNAEPLQACGLGVNPCVNADGDVFGCEILTDPRFVLGNIRTRSLADIVTRGTEIVDWRRQFSQRLQTPKCRACDYRNYCGGGCAAEAYGLTGDILAHTAFCHGVQASYAEYFRHRLTSQRIPDGEIR